jgi:hypothetical protein
MLLPLSDQSSDELEDATGRAGAAVEGASGSGRTGAATAGDTVRSASLLAAVRRFASAASSSAELTGSAEGS